MAKKFSDKDKIERAKRYIVKELNNIRSNTNRSEVLGSATQTLAYCYALLDAEKADEMGILFVAVSIIDEINPQQRNQILHDARQIALWEEAIPDGEKPESENPAEKPRK